MSDQELRGVLEEVIRDIDTGRIPIRRSPRRLAAVLGPPLLALGLGLGAGACTDRAVGVGEEEGRGAPDSGLVRSDAGVDPDATSPPPDAGAIVMYGEPFPETVDAGPQIAYGQPFPEVDAGSMEDYGVPPVEPDGGPYDLYGVPFEPDAGAP